MLQRKLKEETWITKMCQTYWKCISQQCRSLCSRSDLFGTTNATRAFLLKDEAFCSRRSDNFNTDVYDRIAPGAQGEADVRDQEIGWSYDNSFAFA